MPTWIANCIIEGVDAYGKPLTYERAMKNIQGPSFEKMKKQIDNILITKGRADLIKKI